MGALLLASLLILPILISYALRAVTGDTLSAVVFALILLVSMLARFSGRPIAAGDLKKW